MKNLVLLCDQADAAQAPTPQQSEPLPALPPETPKPDAEERMFRGTPLAGSGAASGPLADPLWLETGELDERRRIMREVEAYEGSTAPCGFVTHKVTYRGKAYDAYEFVCWQHKTAYELLAAGVDVRQVAVGV